MDWSMQFFFILLICASGLMELCYSGSHPNLENAQGFEICVIGRMSRSMLFTMQEKSQMSKVFKETGVRMHNMNVDPANASNARTMLRLFTAALANLVFDADNPLKRPERNQNFISALELCSKSLPDSTSSELISEVSRILSSMENKKSRDDSRKSQNLLDKPGDPSASENSKSKTRDKRSYNPLPQSSGEFQTNPSLDSVIAGVLLTTPSFGAAFNDGLSNQYATYYSRAIVEAGLKSAGYDYMMINEALNEVNNAISTLPFMPHTMDYAFAISGSISSVLDAHGLANFADGIGIANALISNLRIISEMPKPVFSLPTSVDSVSSSSAWDSSTDDTRQLPIGAPFQLNPSWDTPPVQTFQFDSTKKYFAPDIVTDTDSQFPLNPSFDNIPAAPLPALDFGSLPVDFSSFPGNIPVQQETFPVSEQHPENPVPSPFPVDEFYQENPIIYNQPVRESTEKSIPFDNMGSQDISFTSFVEPAPAQQPWPLSEQSSQAEPTNPQIFDSFDFNIPQIPSNANTLILPTDSKENASPTSLKDISLTFDQYPHQAGIPEETPIPLIEQSATFSTGKSDGKSDTVFPQTVEKVQLFTGTSIPFESNNQEPSFTITQQEPLTSTNADVTSNDSSLGIPSKIFSSSGESSEIKDLTSDGDVAFPLAPGPFVSSSTSEQSGDESSNSDSTSTDAMSTTYPLDVIQSSTQGMEFSSKVNNLYSTSVTTATTPTKDPYVKSLSDALKTPDKLFEILMDEVNSSLKALNQTPKASTTKSVEFIPITAVSAEADSTSSEQILNATDLERLTTPLPSQNTSPESQPATEQSSDNQSNEQASDFAQRVSSIATSTIAYIRSGNVNIDELCGKLNVLAIMVDIPPVDNCTEIAMIDYLLNVLNAVISTLRRNQ